MQDVFKRKSDLLELGFSKKEVEFLKSFSVVSIADLINCDYFPLNKFSWEIIMKAKNMNMFFVNEFLDEKVVNLGLSDKILVFLFNHNITDLESLIRLSIHDYKDPENKQMVKYIIEQLIDLGLYDSDILSHTRGYSSDIVSLISKLDDKDELLKIGIPDMDNELECQREVLELSVRSLNMPLEEVDRLRKMNIYTIKDLIENTFNDDGSVVSRPYYTLPIVLRFGLVYKNDPRIELKYNYDKNKEYDIGYLMLSDFSESLLKRLGIKTIKDLFSKEHNALELCDFFGKGDFYDKIRMLDLDLVELKEIYQNNVYVDSENNKEKKK